MLTSTLFITGLCLGSFMTCMAERISSGHALTSRQRSQCPHCQHQLRFWQLIPLLGILLQRGRCHDCRARISIRSSLIELLCGGLLAFSSMSFPLTLPLLIGYLVLIFNSLTDYLTFEVYPLTLFLPAGIGLWQQRPPLTISLFLVLALLAGLYLLARLTATFGLGDVDILLMLVFIIPADTLLTCLAIAAIAALVGFIISPPRHRLPFVPFISWSVIMVTQLTGLA
ncbi:prepilin peptidase [Lactiplantibacillus sp. DA1]|uniref:prepilin peptidase n=1 Tax=Lactiplantibacillus sp. DA1 TaxID=3079857 RepID=UPI00292A63FA|nr:prepilin peptidase [Lactiplantibacillus sp. DA1]MDV0429418.1 prepilin peptidase [Lactiplantibacillus sp. DA1]